jgi:hypothetical protein
MLSKLSRHAEKRIGLPAITRNPAARVGVCERAQGLASRFFASSCASSVPPCPRTRIRVAQGHSASILCKARTRALIADNILTTAANLLGEPTLAWA